MDQDYLAPNYKPKDLEVGRGSGSYLYSRSGKKYLDFTSGIGVNCLGHSPKIIQKAINKQASKLLHTSNMFKIDEQAKLAKLISLSIDTKVKYYGYFSNSGAESIEAAIKLARLYANNHGRKPNILTLTRSFHGRTLSTIFASNNKRHVMGFSPKVTGFSQLTIDHFFENKSQTDDTLAKLKTTLASKKFCGILFEPIQGEGGIRVLSKYFLDELYKLCKKHGVLTILDEVQCGNSRSGKTWAFQYSSLKPDILATAKGLGGGFPIGATFAKKDIAKLLTPGTHGSTFGGNPLAIAVATAVFNEITKKDFIKKINVNSKFLTSGIKEISRSFGNQSPILSIRGRGLMLGIYFDKKLIDTNDLISKLFSKKFLVASSQFNSIRLLPPLNVSRQELQLALNYLSSTLKVMLSSKSKNNGKN